MKHRTITSKRSIVPRSQPRKRTAPIGYAVVGLGHIAQVAVLPAFAHAKQNSQLTALVSDNPEKLKALGDRYQVQHRYSYAEYKECLRQGHIDAVYLAVPNHLHCDYTLQAARAGIHVLCEKPMASTLQECRRMIRATEQARVKLMIAYRLHFEAANMETVQVAQSGRLGRLRIFNSLFTMQVRADNIRTKQDFGGGSLYDIGVYCINAARYIFQTNPTKVSAFSVRGSDRRFREVDEMTAAHLTFPDDRLATFLCSFGAADASAYEVIGTEGRVRLDPAYEYVGPHTQSKVINGKTTASFYKAGDQFASELLYFADCIQRNVEPEPSGLEGLIDVAIIEALYRSAKSGRPIALSLPRKKRWPNISQVIRRPPVQKPKEIRVLSPSR